MLLKNILTTSVIILVFHILNKVKINHQKWLIERNLQTGFIRSDIPPCYHNYEMLKVFFFFNIIFET